MALISLDTEFQRVHTYRPILSIVQIKEQNKEPVIYDVLNIKNDTEQIQYLISLLKDENNIKIIHASKQDMEAVYARFHIVMKNIFDTQVGANYLGFGNEIGYKDAVKIFCDKEIIKEKTIQNSKWLKRPLSEEQIFYAKQDVLYLEQIYHSMINRFNVDTEKYNLFLKACKTIEDDKNYKFNPNYIWYKHKNKIPFSIYYKDIKKLFIEREILAFKYNLPREFVWKMKDLILFAETKNKEYLKSVNYKVDKSFFIKMI